MFTVWTGATTASTWQPQLPTDEYGFGKQEEIGITGLWQPSLRVMQEQFTLWHGVHPLALRLEQESFLHLELLMELCVYGILVVLYQVVIRDGYALLYWKVTLGGCGAWPGALMVVSLLLDHEISLSAFGVEHMVAFFLQSYFQSR